MAVELRRHERFWALACTSIGTAITVMSSSIANTALPTIVRTFHITSSESIWVVNGVQLATTTTLLFFAAMSDARGAKRLFLAGLAVFTLGTLGAALAPSFGFLIAMRIVQGLGGSAMLVTCQALNRAMFSKEELGRSVAISSISVAIGTASGPTIGGLILAFAPWPWIFALNVPLGILSFVLGWRYLPNIPGTEAPLDYRSALLAAVAFGGIISALDGVARRMTPLGIATIAAVGIIAMAIFLRRQLRLANPLLAVDLFRSRIFGISIVASSMVYCAQGIAYVSLPFFFQSVLGKSPLQSGLLLSAWPFAALLVALRIGRISDRYPAPLLCLIGILVMGAGLASYALLPVVPATVMLVLCALVSGAGFAIFQTPNNRAIISTAPPEKTGQASGVMSTARLSGQTLGAALVAIVFEIAGSAAGASAAPVRGVTEATLVAACACIAIAAVLSTIRANANAPAAT